ACELVSGLRAEGAAARIVGDNHGFFAVDSPGLVRLWRGPTPCRWDYSSSPNTAMYCQTICPNCRRVLRIPQEFARRTATCPACRSPLVVPEPGSEVMAATPAGVPPRPLPAPPAPALPPIGMPTMRPVAPGYLPAVNFALDIPDGPNPVRGRWTAQA